MYTLIFNLGDFKFPPATTADNRSLRLSSEIVLVFASLGGDGLVFLVDSSSSILATCSIIILATKTFKFAPFWSIIDQLRTSIYASKIRIHRIRNSW